MHIGVPFTSLALIDLRGQVVAQRTLSGGARSGLPPELPRELPQFLAEGAAGRRVIGLGAITGGWVDPERGTVLRHEPLGWRDVPLQEQLERISGLPVHVDNHARAVVQSEMLFGSPEARRSVVHLFVGSVVDAAFGIAGVVHQGPGAAGGRGPSAHRGHHHRLRLRPHRLSAGRRLGSGPGRTGPVGGPAGLPGLPHGGEPGAGR
ncbi:ROK family protein [Streptacidiphilus sp. 4-A2]|nr:ROK family protein [Streptacidiphilus sp. 4-A2]